jgi:DNA polymerase III alpha subunit (gram-positive type)
MIMPPASYIDWGSVLYVVFDLETTRRIWQRDEIIKLAAVIMDNDGVKILEDAFFPNLSSQQDPYHPSSLQS